jgi:nucleoside-diphosphate-sugar epimerase
MNAIISGSNGFIGKHLVKQLLEKGFNVRCLDLQHSDKIENVSYYNIDLTDKDALIKSNVLRDVDYVFHLAGVTKRTSLDEFRVGNVLPTDNLVRTLQMQNTKLKRFVFISSQAAAGPALSYSDPVTEDTPPRPVEAYGMSKLEAEYLVRFQSEKLPITIIRPCSVYGPGDVDFLPIFKQVRSHLSLYPGNKDKFVSIIFIEDLVSGIFKAAASNSTISKVYFLGSDKPVSWQEIYHTIAEIQVKKVLELNLPQKLITVAGRLGDIYSKLRGKYTLINLQKIALSKPKYWICSSNAAQRDFGFKTRHTLKEGFLKTYQYILDNGIL